MGVEARIRTFAAARLAAHRVDVEGRRGSAGHHLRKTRLPFFGDLLGMELELLEYGKVVFVLQTRPAFANSMGTTHGGICATLLDSVMGCAVHTTMDAGVGCATLELKINCIRAVPTDGHRLTATGATIHVGRTIATAKGRVVDDQGRLVAHATTTCVVYR